MSMRRRSANEPLPPCRWCAQPAGIVPLCSAVCFSLAAWAGWFDPRRLWERARQRAIGENAMAYQRKRGACGLFVNDKHPEKSDLTGQMDIACPACGCISAYWVDAWRKQTAAGMKWLSVQLREKLTGGRVDAHKVSAGRLTIPISIGLSDGGARLPLLPDRLTHRRGRDGARRTYAPGRRLARLAGGLPSRPCSTASRPARGRRRERTAPCARRLSAFDGAGRRNPPTVKPLLTLAVLLLLLSAPCWAE